MGFFRDKAKELLKRAVSRSPQEEAAIPTPPSQEDEPETAEQFAQMECGAQELIERLEAGESVLLVDVREGREVAGGMLPDAIHIPMRELGARWEEVADADEIVCYCHSGARSYETAMLLRSKGLFNATSLEGGIVAWRALGGEISAPTK